MHHIFIGNRLLTFRQKDLTLSEEEIIRISAGFRDGDGDAEIACNSPEQAYRTVCSEFREVNAAGGLVQDCDGRYLLIRRNGLWDIPKGHQEEGEDIRTTALREVEEETGVGDLTLGNLICITDHCYVRDGIWHLKHTWWYKMECKGSTATNPQTEEDISEVVWVTEDCLDGIASGTYPSIAEVIEKYLVILKK